MPFTDQSEQDRKAGEEGGSNSPQPFMVIGDRVFQTKEDLEKAYNASQDHIKTVEGENAQYKEKVNTEQHAQGQQDFARQILDGLKQNGKVDQTDQSSKVELNKDDLVKEVFKLVKEERSQETKDANFNECEKAAKSAYGDDYQAKIVDKGKELGMNLDQINQLAETSPAAFNKLLVPATQGETRNSFASGADQSTAALDLNLGQGEENTSASIAKQTSKQSKDMIVGMGEKAGLYKEADSRR